MKREKPVHASVAHSDVFTAHGHAAMYTSTLTLRSAHAHLCPCAVFHEFFVHGPLRPRCIRRMLEVLSPAVPLLPVVVCVPRKHHLLWSALQCPVTPTGAKVDTAFVRGTKGRNKQGRQLTSGRLIWSAARVDQRSIVAVKTLSCSRNTTCHGQHCSVRSHSGE